MQIYCENIEILLQQTDAVSLSQFQLLSVVFSVAGVDAELNGQELMRHVHQRYR